MRFKEFRENKKLSQKELASILGITQGSYSKKESGSRSFTTEELIVLENLYDCTLKDLYNK